MQSLGYSVEVHSNYVKNEYSTSIDSASSFMFEGIFAVLLILMILTVFRMKNRIEKLRNTSKLSFVKLLRLEAAEKKKKKEKTTNLKLKAQDKEMH